MDISVTNTGSAAATSGAQTPAPRRTKDQHIRDVLLPSIKEYQAALEEVERLRVAAGKRRTAKGFAAFDALGDARHACRQVRDDWVDSLIRRGGLLCLVWGRP